MSGKFVTDGSLDIENDIGPETAAILEFTSDIARDKPRHELTFITSKDAFLWAGIAVELARSEPIEIDDLRIKGAIYDALVGLSTPTGAHSGPAPVPRIDIHGFGPNSPVFDVKSGFSDVEHGMYFIQSFLRKVSAQEKFVPERFYGAVNQSILTGYRNCMELNLVTDPAIEVSLGLAIIGFLPFSIVKRTKDGEVIYRKIQAALWKYERDRRRGKTTQTSITFAAARIARAIKTGLVYAYHDATKGEGDEPS